MMNVDVGREIACRNVKFVWKVPQEMFEVLIIRNRRGTGVRKWRERFFRYYKLLGELFHLLLCFSYSIVQGECWDTHSIRKRRGLKSQQNLAPQINPESP